MNEHLVTLLIGMGSIGIMLLMWWWVHMMYRIASEYSRLEFRVKHIRIDNRYDQYYPQVKLKNSFNWETILWVDKNFRLLSKERPDYSVATFTDAEKTCYWYKQQCCKPIGDDQVTTITVCED